RIPRTTSQFGFWSGALFGTVTGMASLLTFQYLFGILRRPRLSSAAILLGEEQFDNDEALAIFIAAESLRSGIQPRRLTTHGSKEILHAGYRNFSESWARDFGFAAYGLLTLKQYDPVKETLEAFFWHQTSEGQLPVKLHSVDVVTRFLHSFFGREQPNEIMLKPKYLSGHGAPSLDGQALLVIAVLAYTRESGNVRFLENHWENLTGAMKWLATYRKGTGDDPLLHQGAFADWADSIARHGRVLYTNVVYWKALSEMAIAATQLNFHQEAVNYSAQAEKVLRAINRHFWRENLGYFVTSDDLTQLSSDGNLLAIAWGLANHKQAESILLVMDRLKMAEPVPTRVTYPSYPRHLVALENLLGGVPNYHTDASWLWIGAWHVIALVKIGHMEQAEKVLSRILKVIVQDRQVNEVHAPDGRPLSSMWYTAEAPLTWNAGMIIYACHIFEDKRHEEHRPLSALFHKPAE
ncbi:MAG TPA: glycoside hydrolase family 15 protein, partial [Anaerolineales bacterium]